MELYEGFSERLNQFLDKYDFPDGRKRASAISKALGVTAFTSQRMIYKDKPPKDSTLSSFIEQIDSQLDIRQVTARLLYGVGPDAFLQDKKDISLVGHIIMNVGTRAEALEIDVSLIPTSGLEQIWDDVYQNAIQNNCKIDQKLIISLLLKYIPE